MRRPATRSRTNGYTIWEMMTIIILLAVVGLALSRLFRTTFRVIDTAPRARDEIVRVDAMLSALRDDIWHGRDVRVESPKSVSVDQINWSIAGEVVTRKSGDDTREWKPISVELSFVASPSGVVLQNARAAGDADDSIVIACHAKLLAANRGGP